LAAVALIAGRGRDEAREPPADLGLGRAGGPNEQDVLAREGGQQQQPHLGVALDEALAHGLDGVLDLAAQQRAACGGG
jgi:hypothetical protein